MIELRPLRQFVTLAEELHFGRAAARLHMTQPPLTQAMQALEKRLGAPLFIRTQRSVALSPAGHALLPEVRRLLQLADALPQQAQAAAAGLAGRVRLAFVSSIAYGPLPGWLRSFRTAQPQVMVQLREATLDVQLDAFSADEIDVGLVLHAPGAAPAALGPFHLDYRSDQLLVIALVLAFLTASGALVANGLAGWAGARWQRSMRPHSAEARC